VNNTVKVPQLAAVREELNEYARLSQLKERNNIVDNDPAIRPDFQNVTIQNNNLINLKS